MNNKFFANELIKWYEYHHRDLPWRRTRNAYYIWLSEIILQQTRIAQGLPYYERFVEAYPTVIDLANAPEQEVIRLWQGLGYYSRARNLHQTAKYIVEELNGAFPTTYAGLLKLKGIGPYTAAAIASFAYDEPVAVVDGNVYRVLSRVFGIDTDITSGDGQRQFANLANELISREQPATYNQAIMEFGAVQCTPSSPDCLLCPVQPHCVAFATGRIHLLPVKVKKTKVRERFFNYFVIVQNGRIAMRQRTDKDVWQKLFDFYLIETDATVQSIDEFTDNQIISSIFSQTTISPPSRIFTHILTHQRIQAQFWVLEVPLEVTLNLPPELAFLTEEEIENVPKPVLVTSYWKEHFF
ncbi:A/G-specific adenine glycosylase [Runella aurantiaca]|uniref:Adenine DNA glycosylase n=1 Tax=Runella aurantiaca TaxID=2282308 RepID=A0A369I2Q6_9BACT|nr:A/G-specific adenine glycosylase [Runella aurantiaca]RDB03312.1 A/G-specific adenine glycosylase [Runella aurantiaca]